jgi:integrase
VASPGGCRTDDRDLDRSRRGTRCRDGRSSRTCDIPHGGGVITSEPKTAKGRRQIALDAVTVEAFKAQAAQQLADRDSAGVAWTETGYVFTMDDGRALHPQSVSRAFDRAIAAARLPRIRLHDLRHTHASLALAAGINPKVVSERLGHATVSITLDTYSHAIPALQEEKVEQHAAIRSPANRSPDEDGHRDGRL